MSDTYTPTTDQPCEHLWPGLFGTHYCRTIVPHDTHVCAEPGCRATSPVHDEGETRDA